jgi:molybdopterin-containing oxidoreductase family membrane subunit
MSRAGAEPRPAEAGDPVLLGRPDDGALTRRLLAPVLAGGGPTWKALFLFTAAGTLVLGAAMLYTFAAGIGVWGNNIPVAWAFAITNFVWWIGIGHAGTFISAILLLFEQRWRTSINRFAEAMTLFAVLNAAMFPVLHLGRPWFAYWLIPYPATMRLWPQFRSALPWDAAAIATYGTVSLLFWYLGLVPDLAAARDTARETWRRRVYGVFALGWRGEAVDWSRYRVAYGLLAGLATPLVLSVHSIVSMDFAIAQLPGWHSTIFPPYFVAGAIYSGFAMVFTLMIPIRRLFRLEDVITLRHLDAAAKLTLVTGLIVLYSYVVENFLAWYSGDENERYTYLVDRLTGPFSWAVWFTYAVNAIAPNLLWFRRVRRSPLALFGLSIAINVSMWLERFWLIVTSLSRDFLPSSWHSYRPTYVDGILFGSTLFFFAFLFLAFLRFVPFVPVSEVKELKHELAREDREAGR